MAAGTFGLKIVVPPGAARPSGRGFLWIPRHGSVAEALQTREGCAGTVAAMTTAATPWGRAELVEELTLAQRAGDKRFSSIVQLLEVPGGERLVRFAYATGGHPAAARSRAPAGRARRAAWIGRCARVEAALEPVSE
jgi:hypothetical protein